MQIQATAVANGGGRKAILTSGVGGSRVGDLFVTSSVSGRTKDGSLPAELGAEIASALDNVCALVTEAGGLAGRLAALLGVRRRGRRRERLHPELARALPAPRRTAPPARRSYGATLSGPERVTFQATAKIGGGKRTNRRSPVGEAQRSAPDGGAIGNLFMTSGILGNPPDPPMPKTASARSSRRLAGQIEDTFANLDELLVAQGANMTDVVLLGAILPDHNDLPLLQRAITSRYPPDRTPALQLWNMPLAAANQINPTLRNSGNLTAAKLALLSR